MKTVLTVEEFIISKLGINGDVKLHQVALPYPSWLELIEEYSILKSKFHVEAALESASEKARSHVDGNGEWISGNISSKINKESILNAYPLDLIKLKHDNIRTTN